MNKALLDKNTGTHTINTHGKCKNDEKNEKKRKEKNTLILSDDLT